MPSYMIRNLPAGLIGRAKDRARQNGTHLDDVLAACLTRYADGTDQSGAGRRGALARAESLSADERSEIAKGAAKSRWAEHNAAKRAAKRAAKQREQEERA